MSSLFFFLDETLPYSQILLRTKDNVTKSCAACRLRGFAAYNCSPGIQKKQEQMIDLEIHEQYPLKDVTTFRIGGPARYFVELHSVNELLTALRFAQNFHLPLCVLGGGSNFLVSDRGFDGLVLKMNLLGRNILEEDAHSILLKVAAGESWDALVAYAVNSGWWGIENLSLIPGSVGALAVQNVGAYGQEASDVIEAVDVYDIGTKTQMRLSSKECGFAYRASIFNSCMKDRYIILNTFFRLAKQSTPRLNYHDFQTAFNDNGNVPTLEEIRSAVIDIRRAKLPDIEKIGSAGSFFKNLLLSAEEFELVHTRIAKQFGHYATKRIEDCKRSQHNRLAIKLPTALLLDICGLTGYQVGGAALYHKHPLIVVNATGHATAYDVMTLVKHVRHAIYRHTGQRISPEPTLIGFKNEELRNYFGLTSQNSRTTPLSLLNQTHV